ncbi:MAG TPA: ribbon-helix-helix protein, CopG family [Vicinamibacteria bacterium]
MATTKVTFTLDDDTIARLRATAERLAIPRSAVVREAIRDFGDRAGRLSERERRRLLEAFDRLVPAIPARPLRDVERELADLRRARRAGGRRAARGAGAR